jgi:pimeloyl-ACP methyl ester carboxylesterase
MFLSAILAVALAPALAADDARLQAALQLFAANRARIESELGHDQAVDLGERLVADREYLVDQVPDGYAPADWRETVEQIVRLDSDAIVELAAGARPSISGQSGLFETFVPSRIDGLWQPVAVYIPSGTSPHEDSVALLLHGRPQSETELLGQPYFRRLADATKTILVAPWGRGAYDYEGSASQDVFDTFDTIVRALAPDTRRMFLAGYSMGGFSVFKIGPERQSWSAVLCISGAMLNSEVPRIRFAWRETPVYVVTGKKDASIPSVYGEQTAEYLAYLGVPTTFYEAPQGEHQVRTLMPSLSAAWTDMIAGIVRANTVPVVGGVPSLNVPPTIQSTLRP